jgi:hypothetical protein
VRKSHVQDAAVRELPPCPVCRAERGDPCRSANNASRAPHAARSSPAAIAERPAPPKRFANVEAVTVSVRCPKCHAPAIDPRSRSYDWPVGELRTLGFPLKCDTCGTAFDVHAPSWAR